jgi:UDP-4-amino-4,6-dideoxy-N-acetyl-beta-L-altrosamine N-acetyltransferase
MVRPMTRADLECVRIWRNHPKVRLHMYTQHEISMVEHQSWFERIHNDPLKHPLIFELDRRPLGFVNFSELAGGGIAEWGFYVAPEAAKGNGKRLGCAALDHAFYQLKLHKVYGQSLARNERSIHFHQALGFQREGILRDQYFDGTQFNDVICLGLLGREWRRRH